MTTDRRSTRRRSFFTATFAISCCTAILAAPGGASAQAAGAMRGITTMELVREMGLGVNIPGDTLWR